MFKISNQPIQRTWRKFWQTIFIPSKWIINEVLGWQSMHKVQYEIHLLNQRVPSIALALMKVTTGYGKEY